MNYSTQEIISRLIPHELNATNYKLELYVDTGNDIDFRLMNDEWDETHKSNNSLTLEDIKNNYENIEIVATLQCSGNRGEGMRKAAGLTFVYVSNQIFCLLFKSNICMTGKRFV